MSLRIQDLKRNDHIKDEEDSYRLMSDPEFVNGMWQVETVTGGDYDYILRDDHPLPLEYDDWLKKRKMSRSSID